MKLVWSAMAAGELRAIRRYSIERWGASVAAQYVSDLRDVAKLVAVHPHRARPLQGTLHLMRARSHYLICEVDDAAKRGTVARLLHVAMDLERHLPST